MTERYESARAALDQLADGLEEPGWEALPFYRALGQIFDLHKPNGLITEAPNIFMPSVCVECEGVPFWPCETARLVLDAVLGGTP